MKILLLFAVGAFLMYLTRDWYPGYTKEDWDEYYKNKKDGDTDSEGGVRS